MEVSRGVRRHVNSGTCRRWPAEDDPSRFDAIPGCTTVPHRGSMNWVMTPSGCGSPRGHEPAPFTTCDRTCWLSSAQERGVGVQCRDPRTMRQGIADISKNVSGLMPDESAGRLFLLLLGLLRLLGLRLGFLHGSMLLSTTVGHRSAPGLKTKPRRIVHFGLFQVGL